jgi:hypothetical protein
MSYAHHYGVRLRSLSRPYIGARICAILNGAECHFDGLYKDFGQEWISCADTELKARLELLIDQWVDSGQCTDGTTCHNPMDRAVGTTPPGYQQSLFELLRPTWSRIRPHFGLCGDGTIAVLDSPPSPDENDPKFSAHEMAAWLLTKLLQSGRERSLARCANPTCRRYFEYDRVQKRVIKQGTFCRDCKSEGSLIRIRASRNKRNMLLVKLAAEFWQGWRPRYGKSRSAWVVQKMNARLSATQQLGTNGKWVTQNEEAINAEVKRRRDG